MPQTERGGTQKSAAIKTSCRHIGGKQAQNGGMIKKVILGRQGSRVSPCSRSNNKCNCSGDRDENIPQPKKLMLINLKKRGKEMRKRLSKISALLMALVMVLSMSSNVFAESAGLDLTYGTSDDFGRINVYGIEDESSTLTVTAYPIILAYYTSTGFADYVGLYDNIQTILETADDNGTVEQISIGLSDLQTVKALIDEGNAADIADFTSYTFGDMAANSYTLTKGTDSVGSYYGAEVAIGTYLVVVENATSVVYNLAVVSTYYDTNEDGDTSITDKPLTITDGSSWVKAAEPTVDKVIVEGNDEVKGNSKNIGDVETFEITVDPIPYYDPSETGITFKITDAMTGLAYVKDSLAVSVYNGTTKVADLTRGTHFTADTIDDAQNIWLDFVVSGSYTLNDYAGYTLVITYDAEITTDAAVNDDANTNTATLDYTTDTDLETASDKDTTYTYTFDIDGTITANVITKVDEDSTPLAGATFGVYTDEDCTTLYTNDVFTTGYVTSDDDGQIYITGLEAGTDQNSGNYWIKEVSAPDGYTLSTEVIRVRIYAEYGTDGQLTKWQILINGVEATTFTVTNGVAEQTYLNGATIANTKTKGLPSTGGYGTMIFTLIGCAVMIISAAAYIKCRDKKAVR